MKLKFNIFGVLLILFTLSLLAHETIAVTLENDGPFNTNNEANERQVLENLGQKSNMTTEDKNDTSSSFRFPEIEQKIGFLIFFL